MDFALFRNTQAGSFLPETAESMKAAAYENPLFRYFTSLKEVSGANIKTIGDYAFLDCTGLASVSFPEVALIYLISVSLTVLSGAAAVYPSF
jgi:hypothetical protein